MQRSLDITERQVLVFYEGDRAQWHSRVLLVRVSGCRWIWATPSLDIQCQDLAVVEDLRPIGRDGPFPQDCRP